MDKEAIFARYYNLALKYISYRPRSEKEVLCYLSEKQKKAQSLSDDIITQIIEKLKEYKFINDYEFAKSWVEQRLKAKHKPIRAIEYELKQKGISKEIINDSFSGIDTKDSDLENAKKLADRKMEFYRNLPPEKRREKVTGYLVRRGFNYEIAKKVLND